MTNSGVRCRWSLFSLSVLVCAPAVAQNLVPNHSFECGADFCDAFQLPQITHFQTYACEWQVPGTGTTDIFSTSAPYYCYTSADSSISSYNPGLQPPLGGNRYAGIYTYSGEDIHGDYREYLMTKLKVPLVTAEVYCAEMHVSRARKMTFAANNLGMRFNVGSVSAGNFASINLAPQIVDRNVISDGVNWTKIGGFFNANNAATHMIIGNFNTDITTTGVVVNTQGSQYFAYYFVDEVRVEKLPYEQYVFNGNTQLCLGDSARITANIGTDFITWTTLEDTLKIIGAGPLLKVAPTQTQSYRAKAVGCDRTVIDTVTVKVVPRPTVNLGRDTTICKSTSLKLDAGDYTSYLWLDKSTNRLLQAAAAGTYGVIAKNEFGCEASDEIVVETLDPPEVNLGSDSFACNEGFPTLRARAGYELYEWSSGTADSVFKPTESGNYWVKATNRCGVASDTVRIYSGSDVTAPNVVTANGDGYNERFVVLPALPNDFPMLEVFDRWGVSVYDNKQYGNDWPGGSDDLTAGVYYYLVAFPSCPPEKGYVHVIR